MQIYLETSSPQWVINVSKLTGVNYVAKNWALVMMLKLCHWLSSRAHCCWITVKKTLKTLVNRRKSDQFLAKFAQKISPNQPYFYRLFFGKVCPKNPREISAKSADFSPNMSMKFPQNLTFFRNLSEALILIASDIQ